MALLLCRKDFLSSTPKKPASRIVFIRYNHYFCYRTEGGVGVGSIALLTKNAYSNVVLVLVLDSSTRVLVPVQVGAVKTVLEQAGHCTCHNKKFPLIRISFR